MSKQTSIYIVDRTLDQIRANGESISGRINQIADRYAEIIELEAEYVRKVFDSAGWEHLVVAWNKLEPDPKKPLLRAVAVRPALERAVANAEQVHKKVVDLTASDFFVLIELLEAELINRTSAPSAQTPATQS